MLFGDFQFIIIIEDISYFIEFIHDKMTPLDSILIRITK